MPNRGSCGFTAMSGSTSEGETAHETKDVTNRKSLPLKHFLKKILIIYTSLKRHVTCAAALVCLAS